MKSKMMVRWGLGVLLGVAIGSTAAMQAQGTEPTVKDELFAGTNIFEKGASDVTEITMDPDSLGLVGGRDSHRAHNMVLNVVHTYEYPKPGMYNMQDVDRFRDKLNTGDWHCSVHTRDLKTGESTDICNKRRADDMLETAIITVEPKELTFIHTIRKRGAGESDMSGYPMVGMLPGLPALAMVDPEMMTLHMEMPNMAMLRLKLETLGKEMPKIDSAEMQRRMADAQKQIDEASKQMKRMKVPELQFNMQPEIPSQPKADGPGTNGGAAQRPE